MSSPVGATFSESLFWWQSSMSVWLIFPGWDVLWYVIQNKVFTLVSLWKGIGSGKGHGTLEQNLHCCTYLARQDCNNQCTSLFTFKENQKARRKIDFACRWQRAMKKLLIFQAVWFPNKNKLVVHVKFIFPFLKFDNAFYKSVFEINLLK